MNLTLGCKEQVENEWIYILRDGTKMSQQEWTGLVEQHVKDNSNQAILKGLEQRAGRKRWFSGDTPIDFALQIYAAKYCTNMERKQETKGQPKVKKMQNKEQFGQISLI